jgi:molybdopterin converting factor small subunit
MDTTMAHLEILMFAGLKAKLHTNRLMISTETPLSVKKLLDLIISLHPNLSEFINKSLVACNGQVVELSKLITEKDEIALLPPMSGG